MEAIRSPVVGGHCSPRLACWVGLVLHDTMRPASTAHKKAKNIPAASITEAKRIVMRVGLEPTNLAIPAPEAGALTARLEEVSLCW
jgi:hypothetical protein